MLGEFASDDLETDVAGLHAVKKFLVTLEQRRFTQEPFGGEPEDLVNLNGMWNQYRIFWHSNGPPGECCAPC